ncbi:MAG: CoA transferase, partial [Alphaproteobacteria bacterium]|nr:CoA transferase [Alphaproteobacteria bacterium]
ADREIFEKLLGIADVLIENFRPGTMEKLKYGYENLKGRYPRLIYAATSGFGHTGPYSPRAAYDMVVQGMGGVMSLTGHPGGPPTRVGTSIGDLTAGLFTAIGINAALLNRERTGQGMKVDVAMLDCQVAILENAIARYVSTGEVPGPMGARHPTITPFAAFAAKDGHIIIAAGNDALFAKMSEALGRKDLPDNPLFRTNALRAEHYAALQNEMESALRKNTVAHWLAALEKAGVPAAPINSVDKVLSDPQVLARNMVVSAQDPVAGTIKMAGNPIKMSGFVDSATRGPAPALDADRARILKELGLA